MRELVELGPIESRSLLGKGGIGRVAVITPEGPHIAPLNYSIVNEAVIFAVPPGSMLAKLADDSDVEFEIDSADHRQQNGWSVVVRGRGEVVSDLEDLREAAPPAWPPRPKDAETPDTYIRLPLGEISGRRLLERRHAERAE